MEKIVRNKNPFENEFVQHVYRQITEGNTLENALAETVSNPPRYVHPGLKPTRAMLRRWFLNAYPNYLRSVTAAVARDLSIKGYSDVSIAQRFGVTTQTVRTWLNA